MLVVPNSCYIIPNVNTLCREVITLYLLKSVIPETEKNRNKKVEPHFFPPIECQSTRQEFNFSQIMLKKKM